MSVTFPSSVWLRRAALGSGLFAASSLASCEAAAMEQEWHVGAGVGVAQPSSAYGAAPQLSLHAAYGLSDMFDARLTVAGSRHEPDAGGDDKTSLFLSTLGLAYKFDIIEWVPYLGFRAGYFHFGPQPLGPYRADGGAIGVMAGLDYSFSRSFAMGLELSYDALLPEGALSGGLIHAEYRFGY